MSVVGKDPQIQYGTIKKPIEEDREMAERAGVCGTSLQFRVSASGEVRVSSPPTFLAARWAVRRVSLQLQ